MGKVKVSKAQQDAEKLLKKIAEKQLTLDVLKAESPIPPLEKEISELKERLTLLMLSKNIEQVQGPDCHATLIQQNYGGRFLATSEDVAEAQPEFRDRKLKSLCAIITKKYGKGSDEFKEIWGRITKRVILPDALEEVVNEGLLSVDEISPAFVEKTKKPYARIFKDE